MHLHQSTSLFPPINQPYYHPTLQLTSSNDFTLPTIINPQLAKELLTGCVIPLVSAVVAVAVTVTAFESVTPAIEREKKEDEKNVRKVFVCLLLVS